MRRPARVPSKRSPLLLVATVLLLAFGASPAPGLAETGATPSLVGPDDGFLVLETLHEEDFTEDDGGWSPASASTWERGIPVAPPEIPIGSLHMWGSDLLGAPDERSCNSLESPPIQLPDASAPGVTTARLSMDLFRDLAPGHDGAAVFVHAEDGFTYLLQPDGGYERTLNRIDPILCLHDHGWYEPVWSSPATGPDDWQRETFDLSSFMGQEIRIELVHGAAPEDPRRGVYLDQVKIEVGAGPGFGADALTDPAKLLAAFCPGSDVPGWRVEGPGATWCKSVPTEPEGRDPVWATNPHGPHGPRECGFLVSDAIDTSLVPGLGALRLTLDHHMDAAIGSGGQVQVSTDDGASWRTVHPEEGFTPTDSRAAVTECLEPGADEVKLIRRNMDSYEEDTFTLRGYDGGTLRFRFAFAGMGSERLGWYLRGLELDRGLAGVPLDALVALPGSDEGESGSDQGLAGLAGIAGPLLNQLLRDGPEDNIPVVITGPAHADVPRFDERGQAMAHFAEAAAPFVERVEAVLEPHGLQIERVWNGAPAVEVTAPVSVLEDLARLEETTHFAYNGKGTVRLIEPEPGEADDEQDEPGAANSEGRKLLQAEEAWDNGYTGSGITISVIDTGIDGTHEAFLDENGDSRIGGWLDLVDGESDPYDDHGHGTHVAGSAAGSDVYDHPEHGAFEEKGVAPDATLLGVKFLNAGGAGDLGDALDALEWSFEQGADITSNSWGSNCQASDSIVSMVRQLTGQGMLSVFAAGNSGPSPGTIGGPACGEESLTVGATDADSKISGFSSRGPCTDPVKPGAQPRICPDVVAKGEDVRSAIPREGATAGDPSGYRTFSGTSMATPHVAGAAALIEQMKLEITGSGWDTADGADKHILEATALPLPAFDSEPDNDHGHGMVQVMNVLHVLEAGNTAHIVDTFFLEKDEIRIGERTDHGFTVQNFGPVPAEGHYEATLTRPDGSVETLKDEPVTLEYLDLEGIVGSFTVSGDTAPGEYTFTGSFSYQWEDPETGETVTDLIEHEAGFLVVRPYIELELGGLEEKAMPGMPQAITFSGGNTGNEDAGQVELRFTVPNEYEFLPPEPTSLLGEEEERYAEPAPSSVHHGDDAVTLVFEVGDLDVGEQVSIQMEIVGAVPDGHRFIGLAAFDDAEENRYGQGIVRHQELGLEG